jgi:hypothetical protein
MMTKPTPRLDLAPGCRLALCLVLAAQTACNAKRIQRFTRADTVASRGGSSGSSPEPTADADDDSPTVDDDSTPPDDDAARDDDSGSSSVPSPDVLEPSPMPTSPGGDPTPPPSPSPPDAGVDPPEPVTPNPEPTPEPSPEIDASVPGVDAGRPDTIPIDDFEDGNLQAIAIGGWWYLTTDTTAGMPTLETEESPERPGDFVLHVAGSEFTDWGIIVGLDLRGSLGFFDATPTNAVRFWARVGIDRTFILRLLEQDGGSYTTLVSLTTEWTEYTVPFSAFGAAADAGALDPARLVHLHFYFGIDEFEAWIDDVQFVTE